MTLPRGQKPRYSVKASDAPHKSERQDIDTGIIQAAPYVAMDRPMMESPAWHALSAKEHEIYPALKAKWGSETSGGKFADNWVPFGVADCTKYGIRIEWDRLDKAMLRFQELGFIEYRKTGLGSGVKNSFRLTGGWRALQWEAVAKKPKISKKFHIPDMGKTRWLEYGKNPPPRPCKIACEDEDCKKNLKTKDHSIGSVQVIGVDADRNSPISTSARPGAWIGSSQGGATSPEEIRATVFRLLDQAGEAIFHETVEQVARWIETYAGGVSEAMKIAESIDPKNGYFCIQLARRLGLPAA